MPENVHKFFEGIGAFAETSLLFYRAIIQSGADITEAVLLTRQFMETQLQMAREAAEEERNGQDDDE